MKESSEILLSHLTFILGGASSGKSAFAESLVMKSGRPRVYLATAQAYDAEMRAKVAAHRRQRGAGWTTIEEPRNLAPVIGAQDAGSVLLLDCATLWLTNVILADETTAPDAACAELVTALVAAPCPVVVVSNEVGLGIVPDNALSRRFRTAQGALNRALAAEADTVVTVMAGLPLVLKGTLPA